MKIDEFIENFVGQFDETPKEVVNAESRFRDLDEWSSLTALSIIAMVDESYGIALTGNDIKNATTIQDLYDVVVRKMS